MRERILFAALCLVAALVPLFHPYLGMDSPVVSFPGWPRHHEGRPLTLLPLSDREAGFATGFPGRLGRFSDGRGEIILRWVTAPTRRLHSSADCLRGIGYRIEAVPRDAPLPRNGCFVAVREGVRLHVCEWITDPDGRRWTDVSSWFWGAFLQQSRGPWWAWSVARRL